MGKDIYNQTASSEKKSADDIIQELYSLVDKENLENDLEFVCGLISHEDKGVRNAASMLLLSRKPEKAPKLIVPFISSEDISVRNLAGEILVKFGSLSVQWLIEYNSDKSDDDQKFIIDLLGLIGDPAAGNHIMEVLSATDNDNVILACIEALGNIKFEESIDILLLFYERNELYKPTIVEALGKIGSQRALDFLLSRFNREDDLTKYSIIESLGTIGDINTYFFLLEQIPNIHGPLVWPLITSIYQLKEKFNLDIPYEDKMKSLLLYTLNEGSADHKKIALKMVKIFNDKDILIASLKFLGDDYELDDMVREKIYNNIGYFLEEIPHLLDSKPENIKHILNLLMGIISSLGEEQKEAIPLLLIRNILHAVSNYLSHPDEEVRRTSMEILFYLDVETAFLFVDTMVADENIWNKMRLIEILELLEIDASTETLARLSNDEDEMVRERAAEIVNYRKSTI
ncbi:HEAT repeat domain-containing protein [Melioribacter sp. OK-6-Me]|uniref:HEAT repeat domain-containing protein n=1 Tax=unclassified Melioribacter TaxID=2627329 RepID=UPI003ED8C1A8